MRDARLVLADGGSDDDGVRAPMTASWLAQMGWQVAVLDAPMPSADARETGPDQAPQPAPPADEPRLPLGDGEKPPLP